MPTQLYENGRFVRHLLEQLFNTTGWEIFSVIERGFRAQVAVKRTLAEWFHYKHLAELRQGDVIEEVQRPDSDGLPDLPIKVRGRMLQVECKNVRSGDVVFRDGLKVEIQKTRTQIGGGPARD